MAGFIEAPGDSLCKIDTVAIIGHITILFMADHLGDAAHVETYAGCTSCHGLDDGVGQIVLQRWRDEEIDSIV